MARLIQLKPHLTTEELRARYRSCQKPQEKVRWHALYLISTGRVAAEAARRVGRASSWVTSLARRYNQEGASAVIRKHFTRSSQRAKVDHKLGQELDAALRAPAPDGGLWTAPKVASWITDKTGQAVHPVTAWRAMRRLGFSLQVPRPQNQRRASAEAQAEFKKKLALEAQALQAAYPDDEVEVWSQDEARFGLKPVLRRVWAPKGSRPLGEVDERYEWLWL